MTEEVSKELNRLLQEGIVEKIEASPWVSPLVVSRKPNGQLRLCAATVQAVTDAPRPTTVKELRNFFGLTGWSSRYITAYADVVRPLAVMLRRRCRLSGRRKWSRASRPSRHWCRAARF